MGEKSYQSGGGGGEGERASPGKKRVNADLANELNVVHVFA